MKLAHLNNFLHRATGRRLMKVPAGHNPEWDLVTLLVDFRDALSQEGSGPPEIQSFKRFLVEHGLRSKAQLFQDLWVLWELGAKRGGYFVEFGAFDGVTLSNTWYMESGFGWTGILAEPNPDCHPAIRRDRTATLDPRCVFDRSGGLVEFSVTSASEFSTISHYADRDAHREARTDSRKVSVATISLDDLLEEHDAPEVIDYVSVDTEGSELPILRALDWKRRHIRCISVEHNYTENQLALHELLSSAGYVRRFPELSKWDGWYIHQDDLQRKRTTTGCGR